MTREGINRILELREILLSFQTGFNLVNAAVVCAVLESISGLEPSSDTTEVLEACNCVKLLFVYFDFLVDAAISLLMPLASFLISLVFLALISKP